ncbi:DUF1963 domain-containing protein [Primorskyibacter sp. 2E107]|uniref:DUF1963 domain-containing protein n=1 Tax=Primorskyibacter sp. 2E107 TaxID=3403458 RepID=UPI003AF64CEA
MIYAARSLFLVGTGVLVFGTVWAVAIWKDVVVLLPDFWDQPFTAISLMAIGGALSWIGKRLGGDVMDEASPMTEFGADVSGAMDFVKHNLGLFKRRKDAPRDPSEVRRDADLRMQAYSDMLEEAPAELHQPRMEPASPASRATDRTRPTDPAKLQIPPEQRSALVAQLLAGGVKAAERFMAEAGTAAADAPRGPDEAGRPEERDFSAADLDPQTPVAFQSGRVKLVAQFPQVPTDSWIGGGPMLPEGVAWPEIGGKPASFYAQIALSDLPEDLWGGLGPREGWMVIFAADEPSTEVVVLHTRERGTTRQAPEEADYYFRLESGEEALSALIGPEALMPPRWYLSVVEDDGAGRPDLCSRSAFDALLEKPTMTDPGFLPFDWVTTVALVDAVDAILERMIRRALADAEAGDPEKAAVAEAMSGMLARVRRLSDKVEARAEVADFSDRDCAKVIGALAKMTNAGWLSEAARAEGRKPISLLQYQGFKRYRKLYEAQARRTYCADPEALPEATLQRLIPVWQAEAAREALFVGNAEDDAAQERLPVDAPCLLLMPPSMLTGWQIGDVSRWALQIAPRDLAMGRFENAFAENGHGAFWDT